MPFWGKIQSLILQASPRLKFDETLVRRLWDRIQNDEPSDTIFDEVQARVCLFLSFKKKKFKKEHNELISKDK